MIEALQADAAKRGHAPTSGDWTHKAKGRPTYALVVRTFGSWSQALEAAGLAERTRERWHNESIVLAIRAEAARRGKTPTSTDWRQAGINPSFHTIVSKFGSWAKALDAAGLEPGWSKDRIIERLRYETDLNGDPPTKLDWLAEAPGRPGHSTVVSIFGSWTAALTAADLVAASPGEIKWTRERIIEALQADANEHGSHPRAQDWRSKGPGRPTTQVVRRRFGSWADAIYAANLHDWPERRPED